MLVFPSMPKAKEALSSSSASESDSEAETKVGLLIFLHIKIHCTFTSAGRLYNFVNAEQFVTGQEEEGN